MVLGCNMAEIFETMPQTVPSAGFTPPSCYDYNVLFAADSFDLSLLPGGDLQVPDNQQLLSLYCDSTSPHMFHAEDIIFDQPKPIKEEPFSPSPFFYQSPTYTPASSPPDFNINIKQEASIDLGAILQESRYLQEIYSEAQRDQEQKKDFIIRSILERDISAAPKSPVSSDSTDHRLLREVLKDTSFQRKYNLKPFDLEGLGTAYKVNKMEEDGQNCSNGHDKNSACAPQSVADLPQESFEPMISMAIEQLKEDVVNTCTVLGIPRDPNHWSEDDVKSWILWNLKQYNHPVSIADYFVMTGVNLIQLTEDDFQQMAPQCGSLLYAQLEIWKAACVEDTNLDVSTLLQDTATQSSSSCGDASEDDDDDETADSPTPLSQASSSSGKIPTGRTGGSHIHLWQFLKELLSQPQLHGSCIRWLDRTKGVFKIEDSVRVARLWGKRKNRPAMNYDKLSRSIRQYYKKGIMKKTERSQRLVYQFCHPYCL